MGRAGGRGRGGLTDSQRAVFSHKERPLVVVQLNCACHVFVTSLAQSVECDQNDAFLYASKSGVEIRGWPR